MTDYADILKRAWSEIPEPKVLPGGSWLLKGLAAKFSPPKGDSDSSTVLFMYQVKEPCEDVNDGEVAELGEDYDFGLNKISYTVWINEDSDWDKVRKHLVRNGVDISGSLEDSFKAFKGTEVIGYVTEAVYTDKKTGEVRPVNNIERFFTSE